TPPEFFRLSRVGSDWTFYWSYDGQWSAENSYVFTRALTVSQAGVFVGNAGDNPAHTIVLDYFFNHAGPIDPEDPVANILEVETTGAGSGQIERDRYCGNPVTLMAVPDAGSRFVGWSGAVNSTDPQVTVAFDRNDTMTAEFEFDGYVVTIDVIDTNGQTTDQGTVSLSPPTNSNGYQSGETVTLSATPSPGWTFVRWQGDLTGAVNPAQIVIDSSKMIEAVFGRFVTLAVTATPADGGTVNASLPGPQYVAGTQLELTAVPADGYMFTGWSGDATETDPVLSLTMDADRTVIANFGRAYALTVITEGQGQVSPAPQEAGYPAGTVVPLTATPAGGYGLVGWDLDGDDQVDSTDASVQVIMDGDKSVKAIFRRLYSLTLSATNGQIVAEPAQTTFFEGDTVVLTPLPASGYAFVGWTGDMSGNAQPAMLEMTGEDTSKEIGAVFAEGYGIVILPPEGMGTVTLDPSTQPYAFGAVVTVTAEPAPDWEFVGWEGDLTGSANPAKITMTGEKQIRALFRAREYRLNLTIPLGMNGQVAVDPTGPYAYNQMVRLTAVPDPGWLFIGWFGDITGTELTVVVTMKANIDVSAHFAREADHTAYLPFVRRP
ncbi:MAG: InlB B-repeat-containing protein, partial [Caldilineaceae bacterium]|nr:InlB B-repeat-containing protein [Caldilineaceae bacterium]